MSELSDIISHEGLGNTAKRLLDFRLDMLHALPNEQHYAKAVETLEAVKDIINPKFYAEYKTAFDTAMDEHRLELVT